MDITSLLYNLIEKSEAITLITLAKDKKEI